jgi:hypothetical protein
MANYSFKQLLALMMLTQEDAAKELGASEFSITRWANNKVTMRTPNRRHFLTVYRDRLKDLGVSANDIIWPERAALYRYEYKVHNPNDHPVDIEVAGQRATIPPSGERTVNQEAARAYPIEPELSEGDLPLLIRAWRGDLVAAPSPALTEKVPDDGAELDQHSSDDLPANRLKDKHSEAESDENPDGESAHDRQVETVSK